MFELDHMLEGNKQCGTPNRGKHVDAVAAGTAPARQGGDHWVRRHVGHPERILGLKTGKAVVMRNIGGRIAPALRQQLGLLGRIGQIAETVPGGGGEFHLIVLQHTDRGITRLANDPAMLAVISMSRRINSPRSA